MVNGEWGMASAGRQVILAAGFLFYPIPHSPVPTGYDFPARQWPDMVARLQVRVADEPDAAGFARVRLTVDVAGPPTLEVEPPQLADALDAWKIGRASSWRIDEDKARWETTLDLRQIEPGLTPIPSVKVRCRANAAAPWEEAEWTDILADLRGLPPPTAVSPPPSQGWWRPWAAGVVGGLLLLFAGAVAFRRRWRRPVPRVPSPEEKALAQLRQLEEAPPAQTASDFAGALSALLRRYVGERFGLPAPRLTTAEFLVACRQAPDITADARDQLASFLERCDFVKFAGASPTAEERQHMLRFVETFILANRKPAASELSTQRGARKEVQERCDPGKG
jgi:hypothetical protein